MQDWIKDFLLDRFKNPGTMQLGTLGKYTKEDIQLVLDGGSSLHDIHVATGVSLKKLEEFMK